MVSDENCTFTAKEFIQRSDWENFYANVKGVFMSENVF